MADGKAYGSIRFLGTTVRCRSGRVSVITNQRVIKSVSIGGGNLRINQAFNSLHSSDESFYSPVKQVVLRLDEFYASCPVSKMTMDAPASGGSCSSELTRLPYEITLSGPNKKGFSIWVDDQALAQRIAKALEHLIKKSGGKEEAF
jgi:hypothetical protein